VPDDRVTHFSGPVRLPAAASRDRAEARPDDLLERLVLTAVHIPRRDRIAGLARRRRLQDRPLPLSPKLAALGVTDHLPPDKVIIDVGDINLALDAAASLVFHHAELLTLQSAPAEDIVDLIYCADGIEALAIAGELGVTVPNEEPEGADPVGEVHDQVAGLPGGPCATRWAVTPRMLTRRAAISMTNNAGVSFRMPSTLLKPRSGPG
jgi:hypothetical protein